MGSCGSPITVAGQSQGDIGYLHATLIPESSGRINDHIDTKAITMSSDDDSSATFTPCESDAEMDTVEKACEVLRGTDESKALRKPQESSITQRSIRPMVTFEVFCGRAGLSRALAKAGFHAIGVDCRYNRDTPLVKCHQLDLTKELDQQKLLHMIESFKPAHVHLAPPCGTASRAREIRRRGLDPKPLRSMQFPDGLPWIIGKDAEKVKAANSLYDFVALVVLRLHIAGTSWSIENPTSSFMWQASPFRSLEILRSENDFQYRVADMQMCMHGGRRDKRTTLWFGAKVDFGELGIMCDKSHTHEPWRVLRNTSDSKFITSKERNYPDLFCRRVADILARSLGTSPPPSVAQRFASGAGLQTRRHANLLPEYSNILLMGNDEWSSRSVPSSIDMCPGVDCAHVQKTRRLQQYMLSDGMRVTYLGEVRMGGDSIGPSKNRAGVHWTEKSFLREAEKLDHPFDERVSLPYDEAKVVFDLAVNGPSWVMQKRSEALRRYVKMAGDLKPKEEKLKSQLHPEVRKVILHKRVLLFKQWLLEIDFDDIAVVDLLLVGVKLIGELDGLDFWETDTTKFATLLPEVLLRTAKEAQQKVLKQGSTWTEEDEEIWRATLEEVDEDLLQGPFDPNQLEEMVGKLWIAARRFPVSQGNKIRPIDDFSEFGTNMCFGSCRKLRMKGVDYVISLARARLEAVSSDRSVRVLCDDGTILSGLLHTEWSLEGWRKLQGRVADLKSAYKQLPSHPAHAFLNIVAVKAPDGSVKLFRALALMFGATAAVYGFIRFSRAIQAIATRSLLLSVVEFFDDFTQVEAEVLADSAMKSMEMMLQLLGWTISMTEDKRKPFAGIFVSLGVQLNFTLGDSEEMVIEVGNKPGRVAAIQKLVDSAISSGIDFKEALSLKGKIRFADGQTHARLTIVASRLLSEWSSVKVKRMLSDELEKSLKFAVWHLEEAEARRIIIGAKKKPVLIFIDGACEEVVTVGGVCVLPGRRVEYFGLEVPEGICDRWRTKVGQKQVIGQAEIYPAVVAKRTWENVICNESVIYFIDNDSARMALTKMYSPIRPSLDLLLECISFDFRCQSRSWYTRVPTTCNLADGPSRMVVSDLLKELGANVVTPRLPGDEEPVKTL